MNVGFPYTVEAEENGVLFVQFISNSQFKTLLK